MEMNSQPNAQSFLPRGGKSFKYPLNRRLDEPLPSLDPLEKENSLILSRNKIYFPLSFCQ
jgi:hypothetical protein